MILNASKRTGELNYEKKIILMSISKSVIMDMEVCFPFGNKTLLKEVIKTMSAGTLETYE
jgi:hypothetical protein